MPPRAHFSAIRHALAACAIYRLYAADDDNMSCLLQDGAMPVDAPMPRRVTRQRLLLLPNDKPLIFHFSPF